MKWGVPEAIGNLAKAYSLQTAEAIPHLQKNTIDNEKNTTVIRWCSAFALGEIAKYNPNTRDQLLPFFEELIKNEKNSGVKKIYSKAVKVIGMNSKAEG